MNRTVHERWQFGDQGGRDNYGDWYLDRRDGTLNERWIVRCISDDSLGISAAETTERRPSVWCSLMHHCHGNRCEVGECIYSFTLSFCYNMIMSYEKGRHLMQRLLICATVTFRAIKFLHPVCLNTSWVPVRMIIQFPANCWDPHVPI